MSERLPRFEPIRASMRIPDYIPTLAVSTPSTVSVEGRRPDNTALPVEGTPSPERHQWVGNVAFAPKYLDRKNGLVVTMVIGEHGQDGETTYHRVYSTKRFAQRIQKAGPEKGQLVEVAGQLQMRDTKQKDGSVKPTPVVYAYGVRVLGNPVPSGHPIPQGRTEDSPPSKPARARSVKP